MLDLSGKCALPPAPPGVTWRYLTPKDAPHLNELIRRIEHVDNPPYRSSWQDVTRFFDPESVWAGIGAIDHQGAIRAFGHLRIRRGSAADIVCHGGVDPTWRGRGLGRYSLMWQTEASEIILHTLEGQRRICIYVEDTDEDLIQHLDVLGYVRDKTYVELVRMLDKTSVASAVARQSKDDPFTVVVPWDPELSEEVRLAANRMAGDEVQWSSEDWKRGWEHFAEDASFLLLDKQTDRSRIVGYVATSIYPQDFDVLGRRQGSIDLLGIDSDYLQHFAFMMEHVVAAYMAKGFDAVGVSADGDVEKGELELYRDCGFSISSTSHLYVKSLDLVNYPFG
ncbi:MAG: hypothetical protein Q4P66_05570 [Actinomycetaceae bacterium]|nr:hypothetical protein [Actinomycetaceae bacterium]